MKTNNTNGTHLAQFLTIDDVLKGVKSRGLPISRRTLDRYKAQGILRAYKLNGKVVFNAADIEKFIRNRSTGGNSPAAPVLTKEAEPLAAEVQRLAKEVSRLARLIETIEAKVMTADETKITHAWLSPARSIEAIEAKVMTAKEAKKFFDNLPVFVKPDWKPPKLPLEF